jgi:hypothetical protein
VIRLTAAMSRGAHGFARADGSIAVLGCEARGNWYSTTKVAPAPAGGLAMTLSPGTIMAFITEQQIGMRCDPPG